MKINITFIEKLNKSLLFLDGLGAALPPPPCETLALKLGPHQPRLLRPHPSHNPVAVLGPPLRHHLPAGGVQVEVGPGSGISPLASTPRGAQSLAAEGGGRGDVHQVVTQRLVDEGFDGGAGCLWGGGGQKTTRSLPPQRI